MLGGTISTNPVRCGFTVGYMLILSGCPGPIRPHAHESKGSRSSIVTGNPPANLHSLCRRTHLPSRSLPLTTMDPENRFATIGTPSLLQQLAPLGPPSSPKRALGMFTPTTVEGLPTPSPQMHFSWRLATTPVLLDRVPGSFTPCTSGSVPPSSFLGAFVRCGAFCRAGCEPAIWGRSIKPIRSGNLGFCFGDAAHSSRPHKSLEVRRKGTRPIVGCGKPDVFNCAEDLVRLVTTHYICVSSIDCSTTLENIPQTFL